MWINEKFTLTKKLVNSSENVAFTKFLPKKCESKFLIGLLPNCAHAMKYILLISRKKG